MTPFFESPQQVDGQPQVVIYNAPWEEVWPTLGLAHEDVALVWGDVPYGAKEKTKRSTRRSNTPTVNGGYGETGRDWRPVAGDNGPFDPAPLLAFPRLVLWGANYYAQRLPPSSTWWWWGKREGTTPDDNGDGELAWTNLGGPPREFQHLWRGLCQGSEKAHGGKRLHPTQKPVALSTWGFQQARLRPGQLVFSPYMGSGPEVASALHLGLRIIACELEREYCEACVSARVRQSALPLELLELPRPTAREVRPASLAEQVNLSLFTPSEGGGGAVTLREESVLAVGLWVFFHVVVLGPTEAVGYSLGLAVLFVTGLLLAQGWRLGWLVCYRVMRRLRRWPH